MLHLATKMHHQNGTSSVCGCRDFSFDKHGVNNAIRKIAGSCDGTRNATRSTVTGVFCDI